MTSYENSHPIGERASESDQSATPFRATLPEGELKEQTLPLLSSALQAELRALREHLHTFRQLDLLEDGRFIDWARDRGTQVYKMAGDSDVEKLWKRGWLKVDDVQVVPRDWRRRYERASKQFEDLGTICDRRPAAGRWQQYQLHLHPFRIYPLIQIIDSMRWRLTRTSVFYGRGVADYARRYVKEFRDFTKTTRWRELLDWWNGIADLAILVEPLFWPQIAGQHSGSTMIEALKNGSSSEATNLEEFRKEALDVLRRLPKAKVAEAHMTLRHEAEGMDSNGELYFILRAASWDKRSRLKGRISGALWLRHMAEVLRRGYEEIYEDRLVHEDEAFGHWYAESRRLLYGSEYPLDNPSEVIRRLLPRWGIHHAVRVRFYVEGDTEAGALELALEGWLGYGVEVINMQAQGWGTWFHRELANDKKAQRFSFIMIDSDDDNVVRCVKAAARKGLIVGLVYQNSPDIEMGCFSAEELREAIESLEESQGLKSLQPLDHCLFDGVKSGKEFEERYCRARSARDLKGRNWGEALMRTAMARRTSYEDESNPLVKAMADAVRCVNADYAYSVKSNRIDPETLKLVSIKNHS